MFGGSTYSLSGVNTTSKTITGLSAGKGYGFKIRAKNANAVSAYTSDMLVTTAPSVPTGVTATATQNTVTVSWNAVTGAAGYIVRLNNQEYPTAASPTNTTISGLKAETSYIYQVCARSKDGVGKYSSSKTIKTLASPPAVPTGIIAQATEKSVMVRWTGDSKVVSYDLLFNGTVYNTVQYYKEVTGLNSNTVYQYQLRAKNSKGSSAYSRAMSICTTPKAPSVTIKTTENTATVSWSAVSGATSYDLSFGGQDYNGVTGTSKTFTGLNPNAKYDCKIRAKNAYGTSSYGSVLTAVTTPNPPATLKGTATKNSATISWNAVAGATSYDLLINGTTYRVNGTSTTVTGLNSGTKYNYQVRANNAFGSSSYSASGTIETIPSPPAAPVNVNATASGTSVTVSWSLINGATGYDVIFNGAVHSVSKNVFTIKGLSPNTIYTYNVRTKNASGAGSYASSQNIRTLLKKPTGVRVEAQARSATITFDPVAGASTYEIAFGAEDYSTRNTSMEITGLKPKTEYFYSVSAKNSYVRSEEPYQGSVTTPAAIPDTPKNITAEASINSIEISFDTAEDATDYDIELDGKVYNVKEGENVINVEEEGQEETAPMVQKSRRAVRMVAPKTASIQVQTMSAKEGSSGRVCAVCHAFPANTPHDHRVRANSEAGSSPFSAKAIIKTGLQAVSGLAGRKSSSSYPDGKPSYTGNDPVNALTGAFLWSYTWFQDYGKDDLHFTVMYDSQRDSFSKVLGKKWSHELNYLLSMDEEYAYFAVPTGDVTAFKKEADGSFQGEGTAYTLCKNEEGLYCVKQTDDTAYLFDENLQLSKIMENGLAAYRFETDEAGHIVRIVGRHGSSLSFTYAGEQITRVEDVMGNTVSLIYRNGMLAQMINTQNKGMSFTYDKAGNLLTITDFTGKVYLTNRYDPRKMLKDIKRPETEPVQSAA